MVTYTNNGPNEVMMKLYNTLTRKLEEVKPLEPPIIKLYTCGPTVYSYQHIGNMRASLVNDFLRRALEIQGYNVQHVMNITDVGHLTSDADEGEDKLEKGAKREGKTVWEVADHFTQAFKQDRERLNILSPNAYTDPKRHDHFARATDFITQQINMVQILLDKNFAYQTEQAIYFDVAKLPDYGILTGQRLADKEVGAREDVVTDSDKRNPHDFAVWFFTVGRYADHSMHWLSPWGDGFPGWHLECSAIIHGTLGDPIDIHTGGIEHIGTHHPNEMAQTEAAFGHKLATIWLHYNHLLVDSSKMAKSVGNVYLLQDLIDRGFSPLAFRLLSLQTHYRSEQNFTWEALEAAQNTLNNLYGWADQIYQDVPQKGLPKDWKTKIAEMVANDLDFPGAIAILFKRIDEYAPNGEDLEVLDQLFGLGLSSRKDISKEQKSLIQEREKARKDKDWKKSDKLRDKLAEQGIGLRDTSSGAIWYCIDT
ncbi:MAG TPA: cysteine--tRNA ligase [Verrucomicrobiae bacterium]|nr:cysteine--tRNA ligase [Verrucomicrobiae bacterium]